MAGRLYAWVLLAIIVGALTGHFQPEFAVKLKPLGDGFIKLIKMLVTPIVFCTVVLGIAAMPDLRKVGRVGIKALVYFEVLTTVALVIGLVVVNTLKPGAGFHVDPTTLDARAVASYAGQAHSQSIVDFLLGIIPTTFTSAFVSGELLQVLLVAVLFGVALAMIGERGRAMVEVLESLSAALFRIVAMVMWLAPLGAMGAMAFTIGRYGLSSLGPLASLMGSFYLTCLLFVVIVLGAVCRLAGFSLFRLLGYIKEEMLTVVGTSSSESVLAPLMEKLERLGCRRTTVGLVVPTGYSFNLDGTSIYLTMAAVFLAQALDIDLTLGQELTIILVAMLTSKGAAAVTGGGFITLAATLAVIPAMPVAALALILGVDRFMSEARALTNLVGNAVATVVVSRWEREVTGDQVQAALAAG